MGAKTIFLDFDGVLHPSDACDEPGKGLRAFVWAYELLRAIGQEPVDLVVHSDWRVFYTLDQLRSMAPWHLSEKIAKTVASDVPKAMAIEQAVAEWGIDDFLVLDDEPVKFKGIDLFAGKVIECDPYEGVSCPSVQRRISLWLAGGPR